MRRRRAVVAGAPLAMLLASCGGPPTLPKAEYAARADAACARENSAEKAILPAPAFDPTQATPGDLPAAAAYLRRFTRPFERLSADLHGLGEPDRDRPAMDEAVIRLDDAVADLRDAAAAAGAARDATRFDDDMSRFSSDIGLAGAAARRFGLRVCGS